MRFLLLFLLFSSPLYLNAQHHSRVKVLLNEEHDMKKLADLGLDVDHGYLQQNEYFINEFSQIELASIQQSGFEIEVLVADVIAHRDELQRRGPAVTTRSVTGCDDVLEEEYETPENYTYGTMGGYYTYQEMLDLLDEMKLKFPDLITVKAPIDTSNLTHEGRPIYFVKISDNPDVDEAEPEVLYDAVHHAREPNSMSQLIFYMWYLLEHYDDDPEIKYLVDQTELYFVPCVNPDGYILNETTDPNGGGFWRKNLRDNGDGTTGVDLNRNYDYLWAYDNSGSSPSTSSQTYRGTAPFSEPETMAMKSFCESHEFQIALNCHTYSNLLVHPWDYDDETTPDHDIFQAFGEIMTRKNNYAHGIGVDVLYAINGGVNDWMYGEQTTKNKIYSFLPEVGPGSFGFWPPQNAIDGLNKDAIYMNLMAAHLVLNYGELDLMNQVYFADTENQISYSLYKYGLADGDLTVTVTPLSANVTSAPVSNTYTIPHLSSVSESFSFDYDPNIVNGDTLFFEITVDNGGYLMTESFYKIYQEGAVEILNEPGDDLNQWLGGWGITDETFFSPPTCITDSPNSNYPFNSNNFTTLTDPVTVVNPTTAVLSFYAKWNIEEAADFAQVYLVKNDVEFYPLCGKYSVPGSLAAAGEPVYEGNQEAWVMEEIDLMEYLSENETAELKIQFRMRANNFIELDGFYFDDVSLDVVDESPVGTSDDDFKEVSIVLQPNPVQDQLNVEIKSETLVSDMEFVVYNMLGEQVFYQTIAQLNFSINASSWASGIYHYEVRKGAVKQTGTFVVER